MRRNAKHYALAAIATLVSSIKAFADALPPERRPAPEADTFTNVMIGVGFAIGGAVLFIWLGRRDAKR